MKYRFGFFFVLTILLVISFSFGKSWRSEVPESRMAALTHGINTAHWFSQATLTPDLFQNRVTDEDAQLIEEMGFQHVRLPLDPKVLLDEDHPDTLNPDNLPYFDAALDRLLDHNLAVIVDLHPENDFKVRLYKEEAFVDTVSQFWQALAQHLSQRDPNHVFLEVLNEPATEDPQDWYAIQEKLLAAMRAGAPRHTLIASANLRADNQWDNIKALTQMTPVRDSNVVYNFHFYAPMTFTHQGATWGESTWQHMHSVPYPATPEAIAALLPEIEDETAKAWLEVYGEERWNVEKLEESIQQAAEWGRSHHVQLTCNEFGAYGYKARMGDRLNWLRDVRTTLEKYDIGWALWEYDAGFGIVSTQDDQRVPNQAMLRVLIAPSNA